MTRFEPVVFNIVLDNPHRGGGLLPGEYPGRFIEIQDPEGGSLLGEWTQRPDGKWEIRISCYMAKDDEVSLTRQEKAAVQKWGTRAGGQQAWVEIFRGGPFPADALEVE